jgi:hypothetical protein
MGKGRKNGFVDVVTKVFEKRKNEAAANSDLRPAGYDM